jgi:nitrogen regulatory protein P-II 1
VVKVQAIIREEQIDAVLERLLMIRVRGLTVFPVKGAGDVGEHRAFFRGGAYPVPFISRLCVEWYGPDQEGDAVVRAIVHSAVTGATGDGNVFVEPVEEAVRIRTGERGLRAV